MSSYDWKEQYEERARELSDAGLYGAADDIRTLVDGLVNLEVELARKDETLGALESERNTLHELVEVDRVAALEAELARKNEELQGIAAFERCYGERKTHKLPCGCHGRQDDDGLLEIVAEGFTCPRKHLRGHRITPVAVMNLAIEKAAALAALAEPTEEPE